MAVTRFQKFGSWTQACWAMATSAKFRPTNDGTLSAVQYVTPVDESGNVITGGGGGGGTPVAPYQGTPLGYQQITAATLATAAALSVPATATYAIIEAEAADIRWRDDGTNPTPTVGMLLYAGIPVPIPFSGDLATVKFIRTQTTSVLNVSYYK